MGSTTELLHVAAIISEKDYGLASAIGSMGNPMRCGWKNQTGDIKMQMQIEWTENEVVETRKFASLYCFSSCSVNANG